MKLINYMPNNSLLNIFDNIDRYFESDFQINSRKPRISIDELDNSYSVSLEMPGIAKKDINITINEGIINIQSQQKENNNKSFYSEIDNYNYSRSFYVPDDANIDKIKAKSSNGILSIDIPKLTEVKKDIKKIAIS